MDYAFIFLWWQTLTFILVLLATIGLSFLPEKKLNPVAPKLKENAVILQSLLVTFVFLIVTLVVQRPIFSGLAILIFLIILIAVSNAKFKALKEPMVFSDFAMFAQAFKHPRLYFPFLGLAPVIIAPILIVGLIILVLSLEASLPFTLSRILSTVIVAVVIFIAIKGMALKLNLSENPAQDNKKYGLQNSLFAYFIQSRTEKHKENILQTLKSSPFALKNKVTNTPPPLFTHSEADRPNITIIQSESFFDARQLHPAINPNILKHFDTINAESIQHGKLNVPAWGANTMRSEFSFLTGLKYQDMGFYRYYPYQFLNGLPLTSIASKLQSQGYYCICIHPHHASFFGRDKIFPQMGFDEFIDIGSFEGDEKFGPYISDDSVTKKILELTREITDKPLFIFAITMENHGPLHLEKTTHSEHKQYYSNSAAKDLPKNLNDLTVYLRHLKNADQMIKILSDKYRQSAKETILCFYGDHVPSMPDVYEDTGYQDNHSDYFIWHSKKTYSTKTKEINIEELAQITLSSSQNYKPSTK